MEKMLSISTIILPIFIIIFVGWILKGKHIVKPSWVKVLNDFVYFISLPALIFQSFYKISWNSEILSSLLSAFIVLTIFSIASGLLLSVLPFSGKLKASLFLIATVANSVYMGFPIIENFTENRSDYVIIPTLVIVHGIIAGLVAIEIWVEKSKRASKYIKDLAQNPLLIALFAGVVSSLLPQALFSLIDTPLKMIASTASPVALFTLGSFMHGRFSKHHLIPMAGAVVVKIVAIPIITLTLFSSFISEESMSIITLSSAMPVAVTAFVLSEKYKLDSKIVASGVVVSTLFSIITLSVLLSYLQ